MGKKSAVWGIDIGQCALKALRCTPGDGDTIIADKYDYIEYPKILSFPEVDVEGSIREAIEQFLSRNNVRGDRVAVSVPGQAGLSRFFKPPPVEARTLPDIVGYEVKSQIPFPIEDVIWDWQQLGGSIVDGRTVDAEIGLFAMKREAVYRALSPFDEADIEVDLVQLSPLAIYNVITHDILEDIPDADELDPENPPESVVVMSMGTDTTDLIVTNGLKLWLRNIPIGGNHFTRQLSREMKLTQTKAEHLKRNAAKAEDPKSVFKAMRPVFNDLINEVQRSLTFFQSMDKTAEIARLVLLGNAGKLPGLRTVLGKQLEMEIAKASEFRHLQGDEVIRQSAFSDNVLSLAPCYGLCLQGLGKARLKTDLLPVEIRKERIIQAKKPWVLAAVGALMLGLLVGYMFKQNAAHRVSEDFEKDGVTWKDSMAQVASEKSRSQGFIDRDLKLKNKLDRLNALNTELMSASEDKATWIEILKAIDTSLPDDTRLADLDAVNPEEIPFEDRDEIYVDHCETRHFDNLSEWWVTVNAIYDNQFDKDLDDSNSLKKLKEEAKKNTETEVNALDEVPGWVIELRCHHYHNGKDNFVDNDWGRVYVIRTLITNLLEREVEFPGAKDIVEGGGTYKFSDFGILRPTIVSVSPDRYEETIVQNSGGKGYSSMGAENEAGAPAGRGPGRGVSGRGSGPGGFAPGLMGGGAGGVSGSPGQSTPGGMPEGYGNFGVQGTGISPTPSGGDRRQDSGPGRNGTANDDTEEAKKQTAWRYDFVVQMAWIPRSPQERFEAREKRLEEEAEAAKAAEEAAKREQQNN